MKFVIDIGSSRLRMVAVKHSFRKYHIFAKEDVLYDGFLDGEFLSEDLTEVFSQLITKMRDKILKPITEVIIGVPNEFCISVCKRISRKFNELHRITDGDITNLFESNLSFGDSEEYAVINYSPMQFVLDDDVKTLDAVGKKTKSLVADVSYLLCKKSFLNTISETLSKLGITDVDFMCKALGQGVMCGRINNQNQFAIVDVGHISTSVAVYKGEGVAMLSSFSMGGGHISSDIMQVLGMKFADAELIKRKVILTIETDKNEYYEVCSKGNLIKAPINITNQIVKSRIETLSKIIADILSFDNVFKGIDVYLTGDGLANFKGSKSILKQALNADVKEFKNPFDNSMDKYQTSVLGLVELIGKTK